MAVDLGKYREMLAGLGDRVKLVAVSKVQPVPAIRELYDLGQRDFGENYVQELVDKQIQLPADIRWHFIGHLQSNKVKNIIPFVHLIQGVDSFKLLKEIDKQAQKAGRVVDCLLQVHIAQEETKFGFDEEGLDALMNGGDGRDGTEHDSGGGPDGTRLSDGGGLHSLKNVRVVGLMGMASFSDDPAGVRKEFRNLKSLFDKYSKGSGKNSGFLEILSMGMSGDYQIAIEEGSNMIRVGSLLFGQRV